MATPIAELRKRMSPATLALADVLFKRLKRQIARQQRCQKQSHRPAPHRP